MQAGTRGLEIHCAGLVAALFTAFLCVSAPGVAAPTDGLMRKGDAGGGALLFRGDQPGLYVPAPILATKVEIDVSGTIARTTVTQYFRNPSDRWVEGIYVFPLPETAAVDRLRLRIGDRFIEGRIKEREAARKAYEAAKAEGKKASLVEQERPNMFTNNVANIGPGDTVVIQIEYQQTVRQDGGDFRLRFPMVVGPRYNPAPALTAALETIVLSDPVPDRDRVTPPVLHPDMDRVNPVTLVVILNAGFPLGDIASPHHAIDVARETPGRAVVTLRDGRTPANRDFELVWTPAPGAAPHAALFHETRDGVPHVLLSVVPPFAAGPVNPPPREIIFVLDVSGSMAGASIVQAKASLRLALDRLRADDAFNLILFNHDARAMFEAPRLATPPNLALARSFVDRVEANGGTELLSAMRMSLDMAAMSAAREDGARLRQVVFLTDGAVGDEDQIFDAIARRIGETRLFTVGIGSAPNSHFMRRASRLGRGTFTHIGDPSQVAERTAELFTKLERPVLTGLTVTWPDGVQVEAWPDPVPDLYHGEAIVVAARLPALRGAVTLSGMVAGEPWRASLDLAQATEGAGVAAVWARHKIMALEESRHRGAAQENVRQAILETALGYDLVSRYTSLVAIDITPSRPAGDALHSRDIPVMFPDGWEWAKVFGEEAPAMRRAAAPDMAPAKMAMAAAMPLPQTATPAQLARLIGLVLVMLGLLVIVARRWRVLSPRVGA